MTLRKQLLSLGLSERHVSLAIPYMFFSPESVQTTAAGVIEIVRAVQRRLRRLGFEVRSSGRVDVATTRALDSLFPPAGSAVRMPFSLIVAGVLRARSVSRLSLSGASIAKGWKHGKDKKNCIGIGSFRSTFQHLQRGINRFSKKLGTPRVGVDGVIGPATVRAAQTIAARIYSPPAELWSQATCEVLADNASAIATSFHSKADALGAPKSGPTAPAPRPGPVTAGLPASSGGASLRKFLPFVLLAGGVVLVASRLKKGTGRDL